eukprot:96186-Prymnesium_polylepis.1
MPANDRTLAFWSSFFWRVLSTPSSSTFALTAALSAVAASMSVAFITSSLPHKLRALKTSPKRRTPHAGQHTPASTRRPAQRAPPAAHPGRAAA